MTYFPPRSGPNNVAEFMISGLPWVTGALAVSTSTATRIDFPYVTQGFQVRPTVGACWVGFTSNGIQGSNRVLATTSSPFEFGTRVRSLWLIASGSAATVDVAATLTLVFHHDFPNLTGSAIYPSGSVNGQIRDYGYGVNGSVASGSGLG